MRQELREQRPGSALVAQQLATTMLVQALRLQLVENANRQSGWLCALMDRQMRAAIASMHAEPAYRWTLEKAGSALGHVPLYFCDEVQSDCGYISDGVPDALAHAACWRDADEVARSDRVHLLIAGIRVGKRFQQGIPASHGVLSETVPPQSLYAGPASDKRSKVRSRPMIPVAV